MIDRIVLGVLFGAGALFLMTGVGGARYGCTSGEWTLSEGNPTGTRIVGAIFIAFAFVFSRLRHK